MTNAFKTLFRAVALTGLSATLLLAQGTRLSETERQRLIALAERLVAHVDDLSEEAGRGAGSAARNRAFRAQVTELENDAVAFRAALLRNRPVDVDTEVERLRQSLTEVRDRIHPRRTPDAGLRTAARNASNVLDEMERFTVADGSRRGKASARFEPGIYADVDDVDRLAADLVEHATRMRELAGRNAPAVAHFEEQARQFQRVAGRRTVADHRPHLQRLQSDLNAALREIRRQGGNEELMNEWEWADGLLGRMSDVGKLSASTRVVPNELLGLSHELHVQMMKAEELARAANRGGEAFARLGDQAYALHHEMHDGRLSYSEAQDRVELTLRRFRNAEGEIRRAGVPAELQEQWRQIAATLEKMRALMGV